MHPIVGWGSIFAVMMMRRYGRLPVLFWSQVGSLLYVSTFRGANVATCVGFSPGFPYRMHVRSQSEYIHGCVAYRSPYVRLKKLTRRPSHAMLDCVLRVSELVRKPDRPLTRAQCPTALVHKSQ